MFTHPAVGERDAGDLLLPVPPQRTLEERRKKERERVKGIAKVSARA